MTAHAGMGDDRAADRRASTAPTGRARTLVWTLLTAITIALATGLLQASWLAWRLLVRHTLIWRPRDFAWMAPMSYLLPMLVLACIAWGGTELLGRWRRGIDRRRVVSAAVLFLGALSLILLVPGLHPAARLILAAGLSLRMAPWVSRRSLGDMGGAAIILLAVTAILGGGERLVRARDEQRAIAKRGEATPGAPNVLLLILDTVRARSLSLYGNARATTPALERLASEATTFDYAFSTSPWTLPSHASMFTGRLPSELAAGWREPLDARYPTVAEAFASRGYATAGFVANTYYAGYDSGLDRGFERYDDYRVTWAQVLWSSTLAQTELAKSIVWNSEWRPRLEAIRRFDLSMDPLRYGQRRSATEISDAFLAWQQAQGTSPYFAFLNFFDAHASYRPLPEYRTLFSPDPGPLDLYEACIRGLDDDVDRLLTEMRRRGALDNTIVVITSDHGEYFGEHGRNGHGNGLHLPVLRVPLMIRYPGHAPAGLRVPDAVSLHELPGTLLSLAGGADDRFPSPSLSRFWATDGAAERVTRVEGRFEYVADAELSPARRRVDISITTDRFHWIQRADRVRELYRYRDDPDEALNIAKDPAFRGVLDSLSAVHAAGRR